MTRVGLFCCYTERYQIKDFLRTQMPVIKTMMMRSFSYACNLRNGMDPKCPISLCQFRYGTRPYLCVRSQAMQWRALGCVLRH
jgi:hypothetical protein